MSHVATVDIEIKDLAALRLACSEIGLEFREGQKTFKWYGRWVNDYSADDAAYRAGIDPKNYGKCDHALSVPGNSKAYEIGVVKQPNGSYKLAWDFYSGGFGLMEKVGQKCGKLVSSYAGHVAKHTLFKQGYAIQSKKTLPDGSVEMVFTHG